MTFINSTVTMSLKSATCLPAHLFLVKQTCKTKDIKVLNMPQKNKPAEID